MAIKRQWFNVKSSEQDDLLSQLPSPGDGRWRRIPGSDLPERFFPPALRAKIPSAVYITVPTSTGGTYVIYSPHRVDGAEIDIDPVGFVKHASPATASGLRVSHGRWDDRTTPLTSGVWYAGPAEGPLADLPRSHFGAVNVIVRAIRARLDGASSA
jgi:hypothetical protein